MSTEEKVERKKSSKRSKKRSADEFGIDPELESTPVKRVKLDEIKKPADTMAIIDVDEVPVEQEGEKESSRFLKRFSYIEYRKPGSGNFTIELMNKQGTTVSRTSFSKRNPDHFTEINDHLEKQQIAFFSSWKQLLWLLRRIGHEVFRIRWLKNDSWKQSCHLKSFELTYSRRLETKEMVYRLGAFFSIESDFITQYDLVKPTDEDEKEPNQADVTVGFKDYDLTASVLEYLRAEYLSERKKK